ncbi:MBL fold metallo-hydrolase [Geomonas subterranea]|uniref:MBL fold metallo-hydrolase n=1 Tax=Geomonas subterranea TaxID=2847989 RepID=A0ABX8LP85_9BACT|nr:MBL fold metallo-hydrolase [Geomonas subterranea]QXE92742.1 MBL fold metallo-hydrolase [Geomonas subterranea]QXM09157.1 MBL fold metallo-hydrolase [Geomonas subterranea]
MKIIPLKKSPATYSCNSYLILGDWNRIDDVNTLIDPGVDGYIADQIRELSTGFGKQPVEQVILTHNHFDHTAGLGAIRSAFGCKVFAYRQGAGVDEVLNDRQFIRAGDDFLQVLHTPGHSSDSICLYAPAAQALFSGDTQVRVLGEGGSYTSEYVAALKWLCGLKIRSIYSGHDEPVLTGGGEILLKSLEEVLRSQRS